MSEELVLTNREEFEKIINPLEQLSTIDIDMKHTTEGLKFGTMDTEEVKGIPTIILSGHRELPISKSGLEDLYKVVGIPVPYANKCPSAILTPHISYFSGIMGGTIRLFAKNQTVIGATGVISPPHTNMEILEQVEKAVGTNSILGFHNVHCHMDHSLFSVVLNKSFSVNSEDTLFGGIEIQNSLVGERTLEISPYIFRQVCTNGMISAENVGRWKRNSNENFEIWAQTATRLAAETLDVEFGRIRRLTEVSVNSEKAVNTLRSLFLKFGISQRTQEEVVAQAASYNQGEGPKTMYDLWNAVTWVGTHSGKLSIASARDMKKIGGFMLKRVSVCNSCGSLCEED